MGTNYYLHTDVCPHCKRERERIHVGKSSAGWPFLFRGYRKWPPDGMPYPITSAYEWREFIADATKHGAKLIDEYGREANLVDFWADVAERQAMPLSDYVRSHLANKRDCEWTDTDGHRFCDSEFS
jgi:hypothetical protein